MTIMIIVMAIGIPLSIIFYVKFFKYMEEEEDPTKILRPFETSEETQQEAQPAQEKEIICPYCQERVENDKYCSNCGEQLN